MPGAVLVGKHVGFARIGTHSILILNTGRRMVDVMRRCRANVRCHARWSDWWARIAFQEACRCAVLATKCTRRLMVQGVIVFLANEKKVRVDHLAPLSLPRSTYPNACRVRNVVVGVHVRRRHTRRCLEIERVRVTSSLDFAVDLRY